MIASRQKTDTVNRIIRKLLQDGVYPSLYRIFDKLSQSRIQWGLPQARLRPALQDQTIGGADGKDIERTYQEIRDDLSTYLHELIDTADSTISGYWMFQARKEILKNRILHLMQSAQGVTSALSIGGAAVYRDTFNDSSLVELSETTAEINLEGGYATIPTSLNSLRPIPLAGASVKNESYPNNGRHGQILDALTDARNTGWYANLGGGTYTCTLVLPTSASSEQANGLFISPLAPMHVKIQYTNDMFNYYTLADEQVNQDRTWMFKDTSVSAIKLEVSGTSVGIRRMKLLHTGFEQEAILESVILRSADLFGGAIPIDSVRLEVDEDCPTHTGIKYSVLPVSADNTEAAAWIPLSSGVAWLSSNTLESQTLIGGSGLNRFSPESNQETLSRKFYISRLEKNPIVESSRLVKGGDPNGGNLGQFAIDYVLHNWKDDMDPSHIPSKDDWSLFGVYNTGYIRPITLASSVTAADPLQTGTQLFYQMASCLTEAEVTTASLSTSKDWLVIGIIGPTPSAQYQSTTSLLKPKGNYRFTTYVYVPEDRVISNKPCLLYNPNAFGGLGHPVIAPFRVYLNDNLVTEVRTAWSGNLVSADLSNYNATFPYKKGWNKLEILVYYTGVRNGTPTPGDPDRDPDVATQGVGIYIGANPYTLARTDPAVKVQAHYQPETMVSEFTLRQIIRPGDKNSWAWTDSAPYRNVILNYNPTSSQSETLDGFLDTESPVMTLTYLLPGASRPTGIRFRAELSRDDEAVSAPKLNGYRIIVNPTGG